MATRGRKPGALSRYTCCVCGAAELVSGGTSRFRCQSCKDRGAGVNRYVHAYALRGKAAASRAVADAIRKGQLPRPETLVCDDCGGQAKFFDHRDYNKPLLVAPVCHGCNLRRGPAIPIHGSLEAIVDRGGVPFTLRLRADQLMRAMGLPTDALAGMPTKLAIAHWRTLLPLFQQPAQPSERI